MTKRKIGEEIYSFDKRSVNFGYQIKKVTLYDHGKANITIAFEDPSKVSRVYFLQSPKVSNKLRFAHVSGFFSMIKNNLIGVKCDRFDLHAVRSRKRLQSFDISFLSNKTDLSLLIGLSNLEGYSIVDNRIIDNSEYLVPVEDLRKETQQKIKRSKSSVYFNKSGETSFNDGHNHRYVIDKNGNGWAISDEHLHEHIIINFAVKPAQSAHTALHVHEIEVNTLTYLREVESFAREMITSEQEKDQRPIY
jgi:hypothetical protein